MRRRSFIAALGGVAAWPLAASAEPPAKLPTIGSPTSAGSHPKGTVHPSTLDLLQKLNFDVTGLRTRGTAIRCRAIHRLNNLRNA